MRRSLLRPAGRGRSATAVFRIALLSMSACVVVCDAVQVVVACGASDRSWQAGAPASTNIGSEMVIESTERLPVLVTVNV